MTVDPIERSEEREIRECPNCKGDVIEPRSGDVWICSGCARRWDAEDLE